MQHFLYCSHMFNPQTTMAIFYSPLLQTKTTRRALTVSAARGAADADTRKLAGLRHPKACGSLSGDCHFKVPAFETRASGNAAQHEPLAVPFYSEGVEPCSGQCGPMNIPFYPRMSNATKRYHISRGKHIQTHLRSLFTLGLRYLSTSQLRGLFVI